MTIPKLRDLLTVNPETQQCDIRNMARVRLSIELKAGVELKDILYAFNEDYQAGHFCSYENPRIFLRFINSSTFDTGSYNDYFSRYQAWQTALKERRLVPSNFALYNNWIEPNYDTLPSLSNQDSFIQIKEPLTNARNIKGYLHPFVQVELDGCTLSYNLENEVISPE